MDCVTNNMLEKGVDGAMTTNRGDWKKMTCCVDPKQDGRLGQEYDENCRNGLLFRVWRFTHVNLNVCYQTHDSGRYYECRATSKKYYDCKK